MCIYLIGKDKKPRISLQLQFWTKHEVTGNSLAYLCIVLCERAGAVTHYVQCRVCPDTFPHINSPWDTKECPIFQRLSPSAITMCYIHGTSEAPSFANLTSESLEGPHTWHIILRLTKLTSEPPTSLAEILALAFPKVENNERNVIVILHCSINQ